jgi:hypothetical protein
MAAAVEDNHWSRRDAVLLLVQLVLFPGSGRWHNSKLSTAHSVMTQLGQSVDYGGLKQC